MRPYQLRRVGVIPKCATHVHRRRHVGDLIEISIRVDGPRGERGGGVGCPAILLGRSH